MSDNSCPVCGEPATGTCKCARRDSRCKNDHEWHTCVVHRKVVLGASDHSTNTYTCTCLSEDKPTPTPPTNPLVAQLTAGGHLGAIRSWMQWHAYNGSSVQWSSDEFLRLEGVTVLDMELLAQRIRDAVVDDVLRQELPSVCDHFYPSETSFAKCRNCGYSKNLHDIKNEIAKRKQR